MSTPPAATPVAEPVETDNSGAGAPLDPATFEGGVYVATSAGEVLVDVAAGELPAKAEELRAEADAGTLLPAEINAANEAEQRRGTCSTWQNAVAGPFGYVNSTTGCAVFGHPGYQRIYNWSNGSDVGLCVQAKGYNSAGAVTWYSLGCAGNQDWSVAWGNVLAETQVRGFSTSGATGAAYIWWD